ncbi:MAG: carboxypeptidase-like regulatory domain-containing protein [Alphaproteobacteria bacterium]|nr:carboxypeptidase-like regulatory domain-containing protein [Alphaproteobacteria bacterium]
MLVRFDDPLRATVLADTREAARALAPDLGGWSEHWRRLDRELALRTLADRPDRGATAAVLRRALVEADGALGRAARLDDAALLEAAAARLAGGWLVEIDRLLPSGGWRSDAPAGTAEQQTEAVTPEEKPTGVPAKKERDHWITVELVGENGEPIPNEKVTVTDPGGEEHQGETDSQGRFTVTGIPEGSCDVTFPELDQEAWEAASDG